MQIKHLKITNVGVFERAEFDFQPGMNLLVGINGAGKSTVLNVLRILYSQILPDFTAAKRRSIARYFDKNRDISIGSGFLAAEMLFDLEPEQTNQPNLFEIEPMHFHHLIYLPYEEFAVDKSRKGEVRHQTVDVEERNELKWVDEQGFSIGNKPPFQVLKKSQQQPIVVFFSPHRSVVESKRSPSGGQAAAFADALEDRALYLNEFALWWRTREELASEDTSARRLLEVL
ncbi:MAG: AAA family ATPase, partial [Chloroflexota bacterium]